MKLLCVITTVLAFFGSSRADQCLNLLSYSSVAFDTINFVPSQAYYDVPYALYFDNILDNGAQFFDFAAGVIYIKNPDGTCVKYESDDFKLANLGLTGLGMKTTNVLSFTDKDGVTRDRKAVTNNKFLIKALFTSNCFSHYAAYYYNDNLQCSYLFINPQSLSSDGVQKIRTARQRFEASSCTIQSLGEDIEGDNKPETEEIVAPKLLIRLSADEEHEESEE